MKKDIKKVETPFQKFQYAPVPSSNFQAIPLNAFLTTVTKADSNEALGIYSREEEWIFLQNLVNDLAISYN